MCLFSKKRFPRIALKDIECYKILRYLKQEKEYETPYMDAIVDEPTILGVKNFKAKYKSHVINLGGGNYEISSGYIHAYAKEDKATTIASYDNDLEFYKSRFEFCVFKCIIPKGTRYYVGDSCDVCAKKIKFVGRVLEPSDNNDLVKKGLAFNAPKGKKSAN